MFFSNNECLIEDVGFNLSLGKSDDECMEKEVKVKQDFEYIDGK